MENDIENNKENSKGHIDTDCNDAAKSVILAIVIILVMYILSLFIGD